MPSCPVCNTPSQGRYPGSPYWTCGACDCWFQDPLPPKTFEGAHEKTADGDFAGHLMSEHDKAVNDDLADWLFVTWLKGKPGRTLDVGSKYPYLAHCLRKRGCDAYGMDNLEVVPEYSRALGVPMLTADFEQVSEERIAEWTRSERFALITMIHVFEHMYEPAAALAKLRHLVADDGHVFLRLPDHGVSGFERDLTPGHYTIHPYYHALPSLLELLVRTRDLFVVAHTATLDGTGQRDVVLKPIARKPVVVAGLIVKNEERDLARALASVEPVVDAAVVVDTGSTDRTPEVATTAIAKPVHFSIFTEASRQDETGDWKLWDFGRARNAFVERIEALGADWVFWVDADDELLTPHNLGRAIYLAGSLDVLGVQIVAGNERWVQHRLWRTGRGIRFEGRCHEYPTIGGHPAMVLSDSIVRHDATPGRGESSNARNLRILRAEFDENPTPRCTFYLANTLSDGGRREEAIPIYAKRIEMGEGYRDEWLFAHLYKARCERSVGRIDDAQRTLLEGASRAPDWAEFWTELGYIAYADRKHYEEAIGYFLVAAAQKPAATLLWREPNKYGDQPLRMISWCHEHQGDLRQALDFARRAKVAIGAPDAEWDARIARLEAAVGGATPGAPFVASGAKRLAIRRPGAIGDILMVLNLLPLLRQKHGEAPIDFHCHPAIGEPLRELFAASGISAVGDSGAMTSEIRSGYDAVFDLVGYPLREGYPERPMRQHLLHYFAEELGVRDQFPPEGLPSLVLPRPPRPGPALPERYATLQVTAGWSVYKEWLLERWTEVVAACRTQGIAVYQVGTAETPRIDGADATFLGSPLSSGIALLANAHLHLGIDSFANHLTHYVWLDPSGKPCSTPGVILWGSTQPSAAGYPHNANLCAGLPCQPCFREDPRLSAMPRGPCINPPGQTYDDPRHECMRRITVPQVVDAMNRLWRRAA